MARLLLLLVFLQFVGGVDALNAQNPLLSEPVPDRVAAQPPPRNSFLTRIAVYQQQLRQKMAAAIRGARATESIRPLFAVLLIAFAYGVVHAAGPGHGKAVAMFFMLSRNPSVASGLLLGTLIAFFHGFSGAMCVLGLHFILQKSVSGTLAAISQTTQIVSFGLIILLGLGILAKNGYALLPKSDSRPAPSPEGLNPKKKGLLPWAMAVGLVPCPGVVMVMLFCLSMDALALGLLLALCVSLGMAATISVVVSTVALGKAGVLNAASRQRTERIENMVGVFSGTAVSAFGTMFLLAALH